MQPGDQIFLQPFAPLPDIHSLPGNFVPGTSVSVLRLDKIDAGISGNKWYKLRYYLEEAMATGRGILTWGGPWSNHIHATAIACQRLGIPSAGIIRGEQPARPSTTLLTAAAAGMELHYTSRREYTDGKVPGSIPAGRYIIVPAGGYGEQGVRGAAGILPSTGAAGYTHLYCAVGTGTTLAGLIRSASPAQQVIGIPVLKDYSLEETIRGLTDGHNNWKLVFGFERGGYARHDNELLSFMNSFYRETGIATDFVYTAKLFLAVQSLLTANPPAAGSRVLLLHTGGLQGNGGLPPQTLLF